MSSDAFNGGVSRSIGSSRALGGGRKTRKLTALRHAVRPAAEEMEQRVMLSSSVLNPAAFTRLGTFTPGPGTYTINTTSDTITGPATSLTGVTSNGVAVFDFTSVDIAGGVTINASGSAPLAILSQGGLTVGGIINASGLSSTDDDPSSVPGGPGGGAGGAVGYETTGNPGGGAGGGGGGNYDYSGAGGGGFGGAGAAGGQYSSYSPGAGGIAYGNLNSTLQGGSGGGGAGESGNGTSVGYIPAGGGGGGAVELSASGTVEISGSILANGGAGSTQDGYDGASGGGSGGGIVIAGATVLVDAAGIVSADGGNGGAGEYTDYGDGGAGGGGRIFVQTASYTNNGSVVANGGTSGAQPSARKGDGNASVNATGFTGVISFPVIGPLAYAVPAGQASNLTLTLDPTGTDLEIINNSNSAIAIDQPLADTTQVQITGAADENSSLTVNYSNGFIAIPISFDGGAGTGTHALTVQGATGVTDTYSPGPATGAGSLSIAEAESNHAVTTNGIHADANFGSGLGNLVDSIQFVNLSPVTDNNTGALVVNGTAGNDAISYTQGSSNAGPPSPLLVDITESGTTATASILTGTVSLAVGETVEISGFSDPGYDGPFIISGLSGGTGGPGTSFTFADATTGLQENFNTITVTPPATGLVTVNNLESIDFANKTGLTINTGSGSDTVTYNEGVAPSGLTNGVTVTAGNPTSKLVYNAPAANSQITVTPGENYDGTIDSGSDALTFNDFPKISVIGGNTAAVPLDIEPSFAASPFGAYTVSDGLSAGSGKITGTSFDTATSNTFALSAITFANINTAPGGGLEFGAITPLAPLGATESSITYNPTYQSNVLVSGDTLAEIVSATPNYFNEVTVNQAGSDGAYLYIGATASNYVYIDENTIQVDTFGPGASSGTQLNYGLVDQDAGNITVSTNPAFGASIQESGFAPVYFGGFNLVGVYSTSGSIDVIGTGSTNTLTVSPTSANSATATTGSLVNPSFLFDVADAGTGGTFTVDPQSGGASVVIDGTAGNDQITAAGASMAPDGSTPGAVVTISGLAALLPVNLIPNDQGTLTINGGNGNDSLTVDSSVAPFAIPIAFNGGVGTNSLTLQGGAALSDTYTPGPAAGAGRDVMAFIYGPGEFNQSVSFTGLAPVVDTVASPLAVNGSSGNDAISYGPGPAATQQFPINSIDAAQPGVGILNVNGSPGVTVGQSVTISGGTNPIFDGTFTVTSAGMNLVFFADPAITGSEAPSSGGTLITSINSGLVTVNNLESIAFQNKPTLALNTGTGNDTVSLNDPTTPAGLTGIAVNGGSGQNVLNVNSYGLPFSVATPGVVTVNGQPPVTYSGIPQVNILNAVTSITTTPAAITGTANKPLIGVTVGAFTGGPVGAIGTDFNATIAWGDGSISAGTVAGVGGAFAVTGSHTYAAGNTYAPVVTLIDRLPVGYTSSGGVSVTVYYATPINSVITDSAVISAPVIVVANVVLSPVLAPVNMIQPGSSTGTIAVATFVDPAGAGPVTNYTASINWGDGHITSGAITLAGGVFTVSGSDTYASAGLYSPVVTVSHLTSTPQSVTDTNRVNVIAPSHITAATGATFTGLEGRSLTATIGNFTYIGTLGSTTGLTATVNWGDGTATMPATITAFRNNTFQITATHTYHEESSAAGYPVTVIVTDSFGDVITIYSIAKIADAPLELPVGAAAATVSSGVAFSNKALGTFRDDDATNTSPANYVGTISWGDGSTSAATFVFTSATVNVGSYWQVEGSHKYATKKTFTVTISIYDVGSPSNIITITTTIKAV